MFSILNYGEMLRYIADSIGSLFDVVWVESFRNMFQIFFLQKEKILMLKMEI